MIGGYHGVGCWVLGVGYNPATNYQEQPVRVGLIGCGNISGTYRKNAGWLDGIEIVACADLDIERARSRAAEFDVPRACSVEEILTDSNIEIILNLTIPKAHAAVSMAALEAGKHVYVEKPLSVDRSDGAKLLEIAR